MSPLFLHRGWSSRIDRAVPLINSQRPPCPPCPPCDAPSSDTELGGQGSAWPFHCLTPKDFRALRAMSPLPTLSSECRDRRGRSTDALDGIPKKSSVSSVSPVPSVRCPLFRHRARSAGIGVAVPPMPRWNPQKILRVLHPLRVLRAMVPFSY